MLVHTSAYIPTLSHSTHQVILPVALAPMHAGNLNGTDLWEKENNVETWGHVWGIRQDFRINTRE